MNKELIKEIAIELSDVSEELAREGSYYEAGRVEALANLLKTEANNER